MGNALGGSWRGVLVAAGVAGLLFAVIMGLAVTGRLGDLKYWSFPGHPYPPTGYYINPFNSGDKGDLVNSAEAGRVKADLLEDGRIELDALRTGNTSRLAQSITGNALPKLQQLISQNNAAGVYELEDVQLTRVTVGRVTDPNDPSVSACVEEVGSVAIRRYARADGRLVGEQSFHFGDRYWLVKSGGRYRITDVQLGASDGPRS